LPTSPIKEVHTQADTTICDAWLEVNISSLQFTNENYNVAWLLKFIKKKQLLHVFFSYARKFVFLFDLMLDIITITFIYSFFNIILLHFAQQKEKYNFTFIFNIFCSKYKFH